MATDTPILENLRQARELLAKMPRMVGTRETLTDKIRAIALTNGYQIIENEYVPPGEVLLISGDIFEGPVGAAKLVNVGE